MYIGVIHTIRLKNYWEIFIPKITYQDPVHFWKLSANNLTNIIQPIHNHICSIVDHKYTVSKLEMGNGKAWKGYIKDLIFFTDVSLHSNKKVQGQEVFSWCVYKYTHLRILTWLWWLFILVIIEWDQRNKSRKVWLPKNILHKCFLNRFKNPNVYVKSS